MNMLRNGLRLMKSRRDFALLMVVQWSAQAGDGLVQAALAKLIVFGGQKGFDLESARSPDDLLRIALFLFVPYTLLSPFLGVLIDRWDRRRLIFVTGVMRGVIILLIALAGTGRIGDAALFVAFLLTLAVSRVVLATKGAGLPETVEDDELVDANAISQLGGALFQLGAAGTAFIAAKFMPVEIPVAAGAIVYLIGAFTAPMISKLGELRTTQGWGAEIAHVARSIWEGLRMVARTPQAGAAITTYLWLRLLWSFSLVAISFIARDLLAGDDLVAVILTGGAGAVGAAIGFLAAGTFRKKVATIGMLVIASSVATGLAVVILGALETKMSIALMAFALGLGFFLAKISLDTLVQQSLGDDFRGRAFSLYDIAYNLGWVFAAGILKIFWEPGTENVLMVSMGVVFLVGMLLLGTWYRRAGLLEPQRVPV
jgi:MFS family permease